jgi:hypothetical protein
MPRSYENELRISDSMGRSFVFSRERLLVHDPSFRMLVAFLNREGIHLYISSTTYQTGNISVKNNLIVRSSQYHVLLEPGVQGPIYFSNNDYYPDGGNSFMLKGSPSNFAGWRNNTGQDANSIVEDPKFVSPAPGTSPCDFGLQPSSPAIGNGTDLGSNEERALAPGVSWPNQVALSIQEKSAGTLELFVTSLRRRENHKILTEP